MSFLLVVQYSIIDHQVSITIVESNDEIKKRDSKSVSY